MTPPPGTLAPSEPTAAAHTAAAVPVRAEGIELLGQLEGSGYQSVPFLVRRADGQTLQVTSLLYATLACIDGRRSYEEIAACLCEEIDRQILAEDVECLVEEKLRPLGLIADADGAQPDVAKANPLLGLRWRFVVSNPRITRKITRPFGVLFRPYVAVPMLVAFAVASGWLLLDKGLASATHQALYNPGLLLLIFALTMLSAGFHEFGHAAACRYGGATPGVMGAGLYLVWPAFYTDVTDSYRLGRWGRVRVDVGGLYFNAIFAAGMFAVWWATRWDALLLIIPAQLLQMVRQLLPFVRFDGYHILADITGVPDLFAHIKPTLLAMAPSRWRRPPRTALKPWARVVVTAWVLLVIPVLLFSLFMMVKLMPRIAATAWDSLGIQAGVLQDSWASGDLVDVGVRILAMFAIALPVAGMAYMLGRVVRRGARRVWRATDGRPTLRRLAVLAAIALLALLAWAWWPRDQYRPIQAHERGTLLQAFDVQPEPMVLAAAELSAPQPVSVIGDGVGAPAAGLHEIVGDDIVAPQGFDGDTLEPRMALVLTPQADSDAARQVVVLPPSDEVDPGSLDPGEWPFPFDPPRAARPGDNQSLAVNTTDGSTLYEVAFALVWVTDGSGPVDQRNEAYALASCTDCTTVAVAFQVILVVGQADTIIPENIAAAVNYSCTGCDTVALAVQLIATLTDMPSDEAMAQLELIWSELDELEAEIESLTLEEIHARLVGIEAAILQVLATDDGASATAEDSDAGTTTVVEPSPEAEDDTGGTATTTEDDGTDDSTSTTTSDTDGDTSPTDEDAAEEPTAEPTAEPSPTPAAESTEAPAGDTSDTTDTTSADEP